MGAILLCAGCGKSAASGPARDAPELFPETEHWGSAIAYRSAESMVSKVQHNSQKTICYLVETGRVECLDTETQSSWSYQPSEGGAVEDFELSSEGELVIAERVKSPVPDRSFLRLSRLDVNHQPVVSKILIDPPTAKDLLHYDVWPDGQIDRYSSTESEVSYDNQPFVLEYIGWRNNTMIRLKWIEDQLYLLAYTYYGLTLYQMTQTLEVAWEASVMPGLAMVPIFGRTASLAAGGAGEVLVVFDMEPGEDQVYREHLERELKQKVLSGDIVAATFSNLGQFKELTIFGKDENNEYLADVFQKEGQLWIAANIRIKKFDRPNDTTELDIVLMTVDLADYQIKNYVVIDYKDEDWALGIWGSPSGNLLIAGRTGYLQVDTNSVVSFGSGLILELSPNGEPIRSVVLTEPRDVGVMSLAALDADRVLFAGWHDAPITHTCEGDPSDTCLLESGMMGLTRLGETDL